MRAAARSGAAIRVVGDGWNAVELPANVTALPLAPYADMLELAGHSRICLDASSYPDGANDRIFNYALNRAVCITNSRNWIEQCFVPEQGVHFYQSSRVKPPMR